jgi:hypothetical protein
MPDAAETTGVAELQELLLATDTLQEFLSLDPPLQFR